MPELAEVVFNASRWRAAIGQHLWLERIHADARCCRLVDTESAQAAFDGVVLQDSWTHGKRMLFGLAGGIFLEIHLGMTGALRTESERSGLDKYDHFVLRGETLYLIFRDPRQFGRIELHRSETGLPEWWRALPPQPHDPGFTKERFDAILSRKGKAPLKALLLQQDDFPGVGNWMADEILWRGRIRPDRTASSLSPKERLALYESCQWVCREAIRIIGSDYSDPPADWLFRHRWRDGGICPRTGKPLRREQIGGRTTCWSPAWQR